MSAGRAYTVGERGPELFVPRTSGTIIPDAVRAKGGGSGHAAGPIHSTMVLKLDGAKGNEEVARISHQMAKRAIEQNNRNILQIVQYRQMVS